MFEFITDEEERGQVGIGTLIVFIAMVLVAAIAAGVLINTAGFLQTKSEATGEEATAQVSNRVTVVGATGNVNTVDQDDAVDNETIQYVNVTVMRASGAENINLSEATVQWIGPDNAETLTNGPESATGTNATKFATVNVNGDSTDVLASQETRIKLVLNATAIRNPGANWQAADGNNNITGLAEGESAQIEITTQYGSTTPYWLSAPESLQGKQAVKL
ncbi:archaellin/type IV pilin N-terminal domain-containing protein [Halobacterium wangiae]|uniref:archaellin/type IV pilin N-terminal domain-containing protein n=1 Tax=Halobacterium wangiae TaxID=2902623 RepID=UPI001E5F9426|nr:archaellin/type IV pilin N-terminal domain-containing protein [Halobacterium wangiae]